MVSPSEMRCAYREWATPGLLAFISLVIAIASVSFSIWDPWHLRQNLNLIEHMGFTFVVGVCAVAIYYSAGLPALYATRMRPWYQALLALAGMNMILAAACTANMYAAYSIFHGGRIPGDSSILEMYGMIAAKTLAVTVTVFPVLMLRIGRRLLSTEAGANPQRCRDGPYQGHATDRGTPTEGPDVTPSAARRRSEVAVSVIDGFGGPEPNSDSNDRNESRGTKAMQAHRAASRPLRDRLNGKLDDIVYIRVSGHYLEVFTLSGSSVFLMRLADAVAELGDGGMQTHRSYWAAYRHVVRLVRRDHRTLLLVSGDYEVPVSRSNLAAVRDFMAKRTATDAGGIVQQAGRVSSPGS